jgi:formate hydrogenlyase transcriptional activator
MSQKQTKLETRFKQIPQTTMERLTEYSWPGNIRELQNVVERAIILSPGLTLIVEPLHDAVEPRASVSDAKPAKPESVDDVMRDHILSVLEACHWRIKGPGAAAERLGMNPSTLCYRMKKLGIVRPRLIRD